jgi:hypothetical protein
MTTTLLSGTIGRVSSVNLIFAPRYSPNKKLVAAGVIAITVDGNSMVKQVGWWAGQTLFQLLSSVVTRPIQQHNYSNISFFRTYTTSFGRQFRPSSGGITKMQKVKLIELRTKLFHLFSSYEVTA